MEDNKYLTEQILTYIGNKRLLINDIENIIKKIQKELKCKKTKNLDLFSGSGIVARMMKRYSSKLYVNDLENYSYIINSCYLTNKSDIDEKKLNSYYETIDAFIKSNIYEGIITQNYAPKDDENIQMDERVFYTNSNAKIIDTIRFAIDKFVDDEYKKYFIAPLLIEASIHTNTSGVFKGFYKNKNTGIGLFGGTEQNSLKRIKGQISLNKPILSNYNCEVEIFKDDAFNVAKKITNIDIAYLDPPYNQHPYGSNYFMLNIIVDNKMPNEISKVSGIPTDWNRSTYNRKQEAFNSFDNLIKHLDAKYIIVSYNSEGFIKFDDMYFMLKKYGEVEFKEINYYVFRGSRNLSNRNTMLKEYLFTLKKKSGE